jgi:hypothetical protein
MCDRFQILYSSKKMNKGVETITHIGGKNSLGQIWSIKLEQAFDGFRSGNWEFFINMNRQTYRVEIQDSEHGLEICSVGTEKNLILELLECPRL